jgi:hypothetical protein
MNVIDEIRARHNETTAVLNGNFNPFTVETADDGYKDRATLLTILDELPCYFEWFWNESDESESCTDNTDVIDQVCPICELRAKLKQKS